MRLSPAATAMLQADFLEEFGVKISDEEAQEVGLKIVRYVYAKELRKKGKFVPQPAKEYN